MKTCPRCGFDPEKEANDRQVMKQIAELLKKLQERQIVVPWLKEEIAQQLTERLPGPKQENGSNGGRSEDMAKTFKQTYGMSQEQLQERLTEVEKALEHSEGQLKKIEEQDTCKECPEKQPVCTACSATDAEAQHETPQHETPEQGKSQHPRAPRSPRLAGEEAPPPGVEVQSFPDTIWFHAQADVYERFDRYVAWYKRNAPAGFVPPPFICADRELMMIESALQYTPSIGVASIALFHECTGERFVWVAWGGEGEEREQRLHALDKPEQRLIEVLRIVVQRLRKEHQELDCKANES